MTFVLFNIVVVFTLTIACFVCLCLASDRTQLCVDIIQQSIIVEVCVCVCAHATDLHDCGVCVWVCDLIRSLYREADGGDCFGTQLKKTLRTTKLSHLQTAGITDCKMTYSHTHTQSKLCSDEIC